MIRFRVDVLCERRCSFRADTDSLADLAGPMRCPRCGGRCEVRKIVALRACCRVPDTDPHAARCPVTRSAA